MATYGEIKTRVQRRVIDAPSAVVAEIPALVNSALRRIQSRHDFKVMETLTAQLVTTVEERTLAAVPSDFKKLRGLPFVLRNRGETFDLVVAPSLEAVIDLFPHSDPNDDGEPRVLLDPEPDDAGTRSWQVWPYPDGQSDWDDGEYRIVVPYWRFLPALSADADTNWFTENAEDYLIAQAVAEAFAVDWDEERMAVWEQKAAVYFREVLAEDKRYRLGDVRHLALRKGVNTPKLRY